MKRFLVIAACGLAVAGCFPVSELEQGPGILGSYVVNGIDPGGIEYTGRVQITPGDTTGDVHVDWVITGAILQGDGTVDGTNLEVDWETVNDPRGSVATGHAEYRIMDDGRLVGTRTVDGFDEVGTETIFPDP